jgi:hypothetical protein
MLAASWNLDDIRQGVQMAAREVPRRRGVVQYRACRFDPPLQNTLENMLRQALDTQTDIGKRRDHYSARVHEIVEEIDGPEHALANHIRDTAEMGDPAGLSFIFSDLCSYRPGLAQTLLSHTEDARELAVATMSPPDRSNFLVRSSHWLVVGNHVVLLQGQGTKRDALERYLRWFLTEVGVMPAATHLLLVPGIRMNATAAKATRVKEISIGPRPSSDAGSSGGRVAVRDQQMEVPAGEATGDRNWLRRVLASLTGSSEGLDAILETLPAESNIKARLILKFSQRKAVILPSLETTQAALRNLDDDEVSYQTTAGSQSGEDLRLSHVVQVKQAEAGVLDRDDVLRALTEAFKYFVSNGFVEDAETES